MHFVLKKNENAKPKVFIARSSSARPEKVKKIVREVEQKYVTEVQGENNEKFNYCKECISNENKSIEN